MDTIQPLFTAIVLAADRESNNPVAKAAGVPCKSLAPIGGIPMVYRVLKALSSSGKVKDRILCGPPKTIMDQEPELCTRVATGEIRWFENQAAPSLSTYHVMKSLPQEIPVLLTTADHALLSPRVVDHFCSEAQASGCDVVAGVALHETVTTAYPETHRTVYRLRDAAYCSCNLFAFLTPRAHEAAYFWHRVEHQRKKPLRVINTFGWVAVMRYLMGQLTLAEALDRISRRLGFKAGVVVIPFPESAIDVDSVSDWRFVKRIVAEKGL